MQRNVPFILSLFFVFFLLSEACVQNLPNIPETISQDSGSREILVETKDFIEKKEHAPEVKNVIEKEIFEKVVKEESREEKDEKSPEKQERQIETIRENGNDRPPPGMILCNGSYVNPRTDFKNCGTCGNNCKNRIKVSPFCPDDSGCKNGHCMELCPSGDCNCGGSCLALDVDSNNCGKCGNKCPVGTTCKNGKCIQD